MFLRWETMCYLNSRAKTKSAFLLNYNFKFSEFNHQILRTIQAKYIKCFVNFVFYVNNIFWSGSHGKQIIFNKNLKKFANKFQNNLFLQCELVHSFWRWQENSISNFVSFCFRPTVNRSLLSTLMSCYQHHKRCRLLITSAITLATMCTMIQRQRPETLLLLTIIG